MKQNGLIAGLLVLLMLCPAAQRIYAQNVIEGTVSDASSGETLISATILLKGTTLGTTTDVEGKFSLDVGDAQDVVLLVSYVGYQDMEIPVSRPFSPVTVKLKLAVLPGQEVVITASRVSETIIQSPVTIQKMNSKDIATAASGDFYQSLGNFKDVDVLTTSLGFKVFNTRGFNSTAPVRTVQFIDGMDNQAPGLNFPVGNLVGANDLDLESVEVISGASSALYGPNAFQGVVSMKTKSPYEFPGISVQVKGGSREYFDGQIRYAQAYGKQKKFALKITGSYTTALDWTADDPEANRYGDIETTQDLSAILRQQPDNQDLTQEERDDFKALLNWLDFNQAAFPGRKTINAPGYMESDLADYHTQSLKLSGGAFYRFNPNLELSYNYKFGLGTAIYQGTNRYSINNIQFQQHKLELTGKNWFIRGYTTKENAGDSYDMVFAATNISKIGVAEYISEYLGRYFDVLDTLTNGFCASCLKPWMVDSANNEGLRAAALAWFLPGTKQFDSLFNEIITDPNLQTGAQFLDESSLQHIEGQYEVTQLPWINILVGASFRRYDPTSYGTIFADTLVNPADTLSDGRNDPNAKYVQISTYEYGAYAQFSKRVFDDKVKLIASVRVDKNKNYDMQWSPRGSIIYSVNDKHHLRISGQSAFRAPTLQNQYIKLDLGPIQLLGNLNGYRNLYTLESVDTFQTTYDSTSVINTALLEQITLKPIQPEQVKTLEFGYRGIYFDKLYVDLSFYFNWYTNFIGDIRVAQPDGTAQAGTESGEDAIITGAYHLYQIPTNAQQTVKTWGVALGISYYLGKGLTAKGNYTYSDINTDNLDDPIIPGFNTPTHKFNLGLQGKRVWRGFGFNVNFKWLDSYEWQSPFGDGNVPSFYLLDGQLSYEFPDWYTTVAVGGSNILNNKHIEAYGGPRIGGMVYASLLFNFTKL